MPERGRFARAAARAAVPLALSCCVVSLAGQVPASGPPTGALADHRAVGSKIWIGHEAEFEAFLKTSPIEREAEIPVGVTRPRHVFFAPGGLAAGGVFKPLQPGLNHGYFENYKAEIAAYELDKLLGLGMVPPTVERRFKGALGSLQLWVEPVELASKKDLAQAPSAAWNRQVRRQRVWDALTGNLDRNQGNLLVDPAWNLILIDHSRAFTQSTAFPFALTKIDREFLEQLKTLDEPTLTARLGTLLFDGPGPLLKRRDLIVQTFEALWKEKGEAAVFTN